MSEKRTYRSSLREKSKAETLDTILSMAVMLHGKGETSLEALAEEAGVSVATIRKYFPTREDLFKGCTEHFAKGLPLPDLYELSRITDPAVRVVTVVRQVYGLLEAALGQSWLAYRLQEESPSMNATIAQTEGFIRAASEVLFIDWKRNVEDAEKREIAGFIRAMLSPLTYRSLRIFGGLEREQCVRQTVLAISDKLAVPVSAEQLDDYRQHEEPGRSG